MRKRYKYLFAIVFLAMGLASSGVIRQQRREAQLKIALMRGIRSKDERAVNAALEAGADANMRDVPVSSSMMHILKDLIARRKPMIQNAPSPTALMRAVEVRSPAIVRDLLKHGAHIDATAEQSASTALIWSASGFGDEPTEAEILRMLLDAGAKVDGTDIHGETALMRAVWTSNTDAIRILIDHGASVGGKSKEGDVFSIAYQANCDETVLRLLNAAKDRKRPKSNATGVDAK